MNTHNICFHGEIRKISIRFDLKENALSGIMLLLCSCQTARTLNKVMLFRVSSSL